METVTNTLDLPTALEEGTMLGPQGSAEVKDQPSRLFTCQI